MLLRRVATGLLGLLLLAGAVGVLHLVGQRACPPPDWAFWRFTEGPDGSRNFACVADP